MITALLLFVMGFYCHINPTVNFLREDDGATVDTASLTVLRNRRGKHGIIE